MEERGRGGAGGRDGYWLGCGCFFCFFFVFFVFIVLLCCLYQPLDTAWNSGAALPWRIVAIAALLLFAAGFIWFFVRLRYRRGFGRPPAGSVWPVLGAGLVLLALVAPAAGEEALGGLIY